MSNVLSQGSPQETRVRLFEHSAIRATIYDPSFQGAPSIGINITAVPTAPGFADDAGDDSLGHLLNGNELEIVDNAVSPTELSAAIAALLGEPLFSIYRSSDTKTERVLANYATLLEMPITTERGESGSAEAFLQFAALAAFGESALVEESPARRTSPAAVQATAIAHRIMIGGTIGTSATATGAVLATNGSQPLLVIVGAATTLFMASAGAGVTLGVHWLGKKLDL